ncbi:MAG: MBL fold metallo-hydrolase [Bacteroidales bacterium]|nr:MBL fold metallo-hydrolase [Bacteroidales bacterium]MDD4822732.1 MBL fold metallo-hydrolase [Bacteroidales bacterium]
MKIVVLSDNRRIDDSLEIEHGLCIYLENDHAKCLLDTGASDLFVRNAAKLNVDLAAVDYVFLSHGHADHTGGLPAFLNVNQKAKIFLSRNVVTQEFFSTRNKIHQISTDFDLTPYSERVIFVDEPMRIKDDILVFSALKSDYQKPKGNSTLYKDAGHGMVPDDFNHEIVVCFGVDKLLVYTGCAHKGLLNILDSIVLKPSQQIETVIGGFHLLDSVPLQPFETKEDIDFIAQELKKNYSHTRFITGHCTGDNVFRQLKVELGDQLSNFHAGYTSLF